MYYDVSDHDTSTSQTHFVNFAVFMVLMTLNLSERSSEVIDFGTKRCAYMISYWTSMVTFVVSRRLSEMLELLYADSHFLPARRYASAGYRDRNVSVRLSVRLSVCPSRAGIVSKRRKLAA